MEILWQQISQRVYSLLTVGDYTFVTRCFHLFPLICPYNFGCLLANESKRQDGALNMANLEAHKISMVGAKMEIQWVWKVGSERSRLETYVKAHIF